MPTVGTADVCIQLFYRPQTELDPDEWYSPQPHSQGPDRIQE